MQSGNNTVVTKKTLLILGGLAVLLVSIVLLLAGGSGRSDSKDSVNGPASTSFYSPLSKSNDSLVISYGGSADPNVDAVETQYRIFGLDSLPLSSQAKQELPNTLPAYIREYLPPTLQYTYIHIAKDSIKQVSNTAYSFDFYVDSPESYFHFERSDSAGSNKINPVRQIPWEGTR